MQLSFFEQINNVTLKLRPFTHIFLVDRSFFPKTKLCPEMEKVRSSWLKFVLEKKHVENHPRKLLQIIQMSKHRWIIPLNLL